jgi:hypothetical protein
MSRWEAFGVFVAVIAALVWFLLRLMDSDRNADARAWHDTGPGVDLVPVSSAQTGSYKAKPVIAHDSAFDAAVSGHSAHTGDPEPCDFGGGDGGGDGGGE